MNVICFSHLRWNFVYQRPQHLISRFSKNNNVFFVEECTYSPEMDGYSIQYKAKNLHIVIPNLQTNSPSLLSSSQRIEAILTCFFNQNNIDTDIFWYYTPMALAYTSTFKPELLVYDCMDELSNFKFAPPELVQYEQQLMRKADIVFTGGNALFDAKKHQHHNIFSFPSSIDKAHFGRAKQTLPQFADQENIPYPRLGFYGVLDERFDIDLIQQAADLQPDWHFVLVGPVVKIDPGMLPKNKNIHYLGSKTYDELPIYLSGWDIALIPFAINDSTKYVSPTKTPEYLAGGKPVISTPITDVINPYGSNSLVHIVSNATELVQKATIELSNSNKDKWNIKVEKYLDTISWDKTWGNMNRLINLELTKKRKKYDKPKQEAYV